MCLGETPRSQRRTARLESSFDVRNFPRRLKPLFLENPHPNLAEREVRMGTCLQADC